MRAALVVAAILLAVASGSPADGAAPAATAPAPGQKPGDSRVIDLEVTGGMQIVQGSQPIKDVAVMPGETLLFRITNSAGFDHDIRIGTAAQLTGPDASGLPGTGVWKDGTQEFAWSVPESLSGLELGCTQPGHYPVEHVTLRSTMSEPIASPIPLPVVSDDGDAFGLGGRVDVPGAAFAVTLPGDWAWVRHAPGNALDWLTPFIEDPASDPDVAGQARALQVMAAGSGAYLAAVSPVQLNASGLFYPVCRFHAVPAAGLSLDEAVTATIPTLPAYLGRPVQTRLQLAAVDAVRLDYGPVTDANGVDETFSLYAVGEGATRYWIACSSWGEFPDDRWLSIAGTFEILR